MLHHHLPLLLRKYRIPLILTIFISISVVIRTYQLTDQFALSPDDVLHLVIAQGESIKDVLLRSSREVHAPLTYLILFIMMKISHNELFLRSLGLFPAFLLPIPLYFIGKQLIGRTAGLCMSFIGTFAISLLLTSETIRVYSLGLLFISLGYLSLLSFLNKPTSRTLAGYSVCALFAVLSDYQMFGPLAGLSLAAVIWLSTEKKSWKLILSLIISNVPVMIILGIAFYLQGSHEWFGTSEHRTAALDWWLTSGYPTTLGGYVIQTIAILFTFSPPLIPVALTYATPVGVWFSVKNKRLLISIPFISLLTVSIILARMKLYPYIGTRHMLHLFIPTAVVAAYGVHELGLLIAAKLSTKYNADNNSLRGMIKDVGQLSFVILCVIQLSAALRSDLYRSNYPQSSGEFPITREMYTQTFDYLNKHIREGDLIIADQQAAMYFLYLANSTDNATILNPVGKTIYGQIPVYFHNAWSKRHSTAELTLINEQIIADGLLPTRGRVWFVSLGWKRLAYLDEAIKNPTGDTYFETTFEQGSLNTGSVIASVASQQLQPLILTIAQE